MRFDWSSFATGFMNRTVEIRDQRREEAKDYEDEQRTAAERNAQVISRRRAIADQVTGYAGYLQSNGVTDAQLQATISSGPQAIQALTERVQQAVQANGGRPLGATDVDAIISMPEGFTPLDMTAQEFIDNTYGLSVTPSAREEQDFSFLDRVAGRDQMSRAQERLNRTPIVEGMTIEEVNRAAMQGDYQSLIPGTFASIVGRTAAPYGVSQRAEVSSDFVNTLDRLLDNVRGSDAYRSINPSDAEARQALLRDTTDSFIRNSVDQYGMDFLADQATFLGLQLGEDYVNNLISDYTTADTATTPVTPAVPTATAVDTDAVDAAVREALGGAVPAEPVEPPVTTGIVTPEVTQTVLPPADPAVPVPADTAVPPAATPRVVPTNQEQFGDPLGRSVSEGVTFAEWQGMSRSERKAFGLPESTLGGQRHFNRFSVGLGRQDPDQKFNADGPIPTPEEEAAQERRNAGALDTAAQLEQLRQEQRVYETLRAQGVDDMSINLLRTRGADMLQYAREAGASTREDIFAALNQYSKEKGVFLPLDPGPLVYAISNVLLDQQ